MAITAARHEFIALLGGAMLLAVSTAVPSVAQTAVDLDLVLAVDASGSVDATRFELQQRGYVAAFRSGQVLEAIRGGANQSIAVAMVQWTGPRLQAEIVPWAVVKDQASANSVATLIENTPRRLFSGGTSISGAIDYAMKWFTQNPFKTDRHVIDVSGDGSNNSGRSITGARDEAVAAGVVTLKPRDRSATVTVAHPGRVLALMPLAAVNGRV